MHACKNSAGARTGAADYKEVKVHLEHVAMLVVHGVPHDGFLELKDPATVGDLLDLLRLSPNHQRTVIVFVNQHRARVGTALAEGDQIFLGLPMGGG